MKEDFFSVTAPKLSGLNDSERHIYDYIVQNIHSVKDESIRALAHNCFVSTTTMFRFVQKLGFSGYADFINLLRLTDYMQDAGEPHAEESFDDWESAFLAAINDFVQTVKEKDAQTFASFLNRDSTVVLISDSYCYEAARYAKRMLNVNGIRADVPMFTYEYAGISRYLKKNDVLWVFSLTGQENSLLECIERLRADNTLRVVAFADEDNLMLRKLSDLFISFSIHSELQSIHRRSLVPLMIGIDRFMYCYQRKTENTTEEE